MPFLKLKLKATKKDPEKQKQELETKAISDNAGKEAVKIVQKDVAGKKEKVAMHSTAEGELTEMPAKTHIYQPVYKLISSSTRENVLVNRLGTHRIRYSRLR